MKNKKKRLSASPWSLTEKRIITNVILDLRKLSINLYVKDTDKSQSRNVGNGAERVSFGKP